MRIVVWLASGPLITQAERSHATAGLAVAGLIDLQ